MWICWYNIGYGWREKKYPLWLKVVTLGVAVLIENASQESNIRRTYGPYGGVQELPPVAPKPRRQNRSFADETSKKYD